MWFIGEWKNAGRSMVTANADCNLIKRSVCLVIKNA